jgi:hypothetical protein
LQEGKDIARLAWAGFIDAVNSAVVIGKVDSEVEAVYLEIGQREAAVAAAYELSPLVKVAHEGGDAALETAAKDTLFSRIFGEVNFTGVLKIFGAVAAVAMAGWSLWTLIDDVKKNGSVTTKVFDSLIFVANFLAAACIVVSLFVSSTVIPIFGAVLAIIGAILAFLAGYLEKPANPIDQWMVNVGIPFVDSLKTETHKPNVNFLFDPFGVGILAPA